MEKILVTGLSGLIGGLLRPALASRFKLRALNRSPVPGVETVQADINDRAAIAPAFTGIDVVVHLAAFLGADAGQLLASNVNGTYQVFEAARAAGVRRIVYASSGATVGGYEADEPFRAMAEGRWAEVPAERPLVTHADPVRPSGVYGVTKVFGEALARYYADTFGLSMLCLRIGAVRPANRPDDARQAAVFLSHADVVAGHRALHRRSSRGAFRHHVRPSPTTAAATVTWNTPAAPSASRRRTESPTGPLPDLKRR